MEKQRDAVQLENQIGKPIMAMKIFRTAQTAVCKAVRHGQAAAQARQHPARAGGNWLEDVRCGPHLQDRERSCKRVDRTRHFK